MRTPASSSSGGRRPTDPDGGFGVPRQQYTVARVKRDILERSFVGAMFVNRQGATSAGGTRYNRGAGLDAEFNLTDHYQLKAFLMGTSTPGVRSGSLSGRVDSNFENNLFRFITVYEDVGAHFNPEVGFAERTGFHRYFGQALGRQSGRVGRGATDIELKLPDVLAFDAQQGRVRRT